MIWGCGVRLPRGRVCAGELLCTTCRDAREFAEAITKCVRDGQAAQRAVDALGAGPKKRRTR